MEDFESVDVPIDKLRPLRDRKVTEREFERIRASVKSMGLLEPLIIYPDGDGYVILDGVQRYRILLELGVEVVPCILGKQREAFTGNRMVNRVSAVQENRMIENSLQELDERTIATALGISGLSHRLKKTLLSRLHPDASALLDHDKITRGCALELTFVKPERQKEIVSSMRTHDDFTMPFVRSQIQKTPAPLRDLRNRKNNPWDRSAQRKNDLLKQLAEAEQKHDFYSRLYKQYTIDLLRLAIFARSLLTNARVREYLASHHSGIVEHFEAVIADSKG